MSMHIPSDIDTDSNNIATFLPRMAASPTPSNMQDDVLVILQREQDRAMSLLSSSPLLSNLFVSYANRAADFESTCATPSPEGEEWKVLRDGLAAMREENRKLKLENREMARDLEAAGASHEAFRSQVSSFKEVNTTQQSEIKSLRADLDKLEDLYDRLKRDSAAEKTDRQTQISDLEAQQTELKETIVEQQVKIAKLEHRLLDDASPLMTPRRTPSPPLLEGSSTTVHASRAF